MKSGKIIVSLNKKCYYVIISFLNSINHTKGFRNNLKINESGIN